MSFWWLCFPAAPTVEVSIRTDLDQITIRTKSRANLGPDDNVAMKSGSAKKTKKNFTSILAAKKIILKINKKREREKIFSVVEFHSMIFWTHGIIFHMAGFSKLSVEYQVQRTALNVTSLTPLIWIFLSERFFDSIGEGFVYNFLEYWFVWWCKHFYWLASFQIFCWIFSVSISSVKALFLNKLLIMH